MKTARDIMTANPKFISSGEDIKRAMRMFFENNIHYAPVLTPNKEVLGLFSEVALVKAALKHYLEADSTEKVVHHRELFDEPAFVEDDDAIECVVKAMIKSPTHRVLVTNKQGFLVGIISPKDILRLISGQQEKASHLRVELDRTTKSQSEPSAELSAKVETLEQSLMVYKNVFEDSPYMMHSVDASGVIVMANKRIHEVLGYEFGELVGMNLSDLYPKTVLHEAIQGLDIIKEKGHHQMTYTTMLRKNREKMRVDIASSSVRNKRGDFLGTITISREVDAEELLRALNGIMDTPVRVG